MSALEGQEGTLGTLVHFQCQLSYTGPLTVSKWSGESFCIRDQTTSNCFFGAESHPESPTCHVDGQVKEISQFSPTLAKMWELMHPLYILGDHWKPWVSQSIDCRRVTLHCDSALELAPNGSHTGSWEKGDTLNEDKMHSKGRAGTGGLCSVKGSWAW